MKIVLRAERLNSFKQQGMHKAILLFWEAVYLMDLLLLYAASRVGAFTSLIKLIDVNLK